MDILSVLLFAILSHQIVYRKRRAIIIYMNDTVIIKKTADVKKVQDEVITIKPKAPKKDKEKDDYFGNMMVNKIKINKNN